VLAPERYEHGQCARAPRPPHAPLERDPDLAPALSLALHHDQEVDSEPAAAYFGELMSYG